VETTYTWADALLPAIKTALQRQQRWNDRDVGLWSSGIQKEEAKRNVSQLVKRLNEDLNDFDTTDFLEAWDAAEQEQSREVPAGNFKRNPFVSCVLISATAEKEFQVQIESTVRKSQTFILKLPWKFYASFLHVVTGPSIQRVEDYSHSPELLSELFRYRVLRHCD
jgi:hypothetical protein